MESGRQAYLDREAGRLAVEAVAAASDPVSGHLDPGSDPAVREWEADRVKNVPSANLRKTKITS